MNSKTFSIIDSYIKKLVTFGIIIRRCLLRGLFEWYFIWEHTSKPTCKIDIGKMYVDKETEPFLIDSTEKNQTSSIHPCQTSSIMHTTKSLVIISLTWNSWNKFAFNYLYWTAEPSVKFLWYNKKTDLHILFYWTIYTFKGY